MTSQLVSNVSDRMRVILLGAPGSGKGTFAEFLTTHLNVPAISTGDLIRYEIKKGTKIGKQVAELAASGALVSDEIILDLVKKRLAKPDCQNGYILDGFPRTIAQAKALEQFAQIDFVLEIYLNEVVIVQTTVMRRNCANCRRGYNLADIDLPGIRMTPLAPKVPGVCDSCGGPLVQRADDKEDVIKRRLKIYHEATEPLKAYYQSQNKLVTFEVRRGKKDWPLLRAVVNERVKAIQKENKAALKAQKEASSKDSKTVSGQKQPPREPDGRSQL